jgi:hypothetical protein
MCFAYAWSYWPVGTDKSQYMHAFAYGVAVQLSRTEDKLKMAEDAQSAGYGGGGG